jgi:hypothetical protein
MDQWTPKFDPLGARNFDNPWRSGTWYSTLPSSKSFCNMKIVSFIHHGSWMLIAGKNTEHVQFCIIQRPIQK